MKAATKTQTRTLWLIGGAVIALVILLPLLAVVLIAHVRINRLELTLLTTTENLQTLERRVMELEDRLRYSNSEDSGDSENNDDTEQFMVGDILKDGVDAGRKLYEMLSDRVDTQSRESSGESLSRMKRKGKKKDKCKKNKKCGPTAAHIIGDGKYGRATVNVGRDGVLDLWRYADWMRDDPNKEKFLLSVDGTITVIEGGLYYVYSQVRYYDKLTMAHVVNINGNPFITCTQSTLQHSLESKEDADPPGIDEGQSKYNTCYTGGVTKLDDRSEVTVNIPYPNRVVNMHKDSSFIGFIKLVA
ncbi:uncharacterized protein LOC100378437 isoform X1 [Saccoglossus kowalevskii]